MVCAYVAYAIKVATVAYSRKETDHLEDLSEDLRIILKWSSKKCSVAWVRDQWRDFMKTTIKLWLHKRWEFTD
jgi:hypothetical protein